MFTDEQMKAFQEATRPAVEWLKENGNPHQSIIIEDTFVRVVSDEIGYPVKPAD